MAVTFSIPETITVHLGAPDDNTVANVTVDFPTYIKNVASSEIYPTWPESAIRANIYAQISYALNRVFTEYYRTQGYNFDITNTTQYDQSFVNGREIFENISQIVDDIFNDYITRAGNLEPLFAQYCNGTTTTCDGLSQWGTVELANQGYGPYDILTYYYGDDITLVTNAPVADVSETYPGTPLRLGDFGNDVKRIQLQLNAISRNYPAIPKIAVTDGLFDVTTENAVKEFQKIFNLTQDGIVGKATWYQIAYVFNGVRKLSELDSLGLSLADISRQFKEELKEGDRGTEVAVVQYYLNFVGLFDPQIPPIAYDGIYGPATTASVEAFQRAYGLPVTGTVNQATWDALYDAYETTRNSLPADYQFTYGVPFDGQILRLGSTGERVSMLQTYLTLISESFPAIPAVTPTGYFGPETQAAVTAFQREFGIPPRGVVGAATWGAISDLYALLRDGQDKSFGQFPGYELSEEVAE